MLTAQVRAACHRLQEALPSLHVLHNVIKRILKLIRSLLVLHPVFGKYSFHTFSLQLHFSHFCQGGISLCPEGRGGRVWPRVSPENGQVCRPCD